jgi:hypothetical protein
MKFLCRFLLILVLMVGARFEASAQTLDQVAAANVGLGAVTIYSAGIGNNNNNRRCIDSYALHNSPNPVIYDCNYSIPQKWLLMGTGLSNAFQIAYQADPTQCLTWPTSWGSWSNISESACQSPAPISQLFNFNSSGMISAVGAAAGESGDGICLNIYNNNWGNGTNLIAWPCNGQNNELWTIQPDPTILYRLRDQNMAQSGASGADIVVQGASTSSGAGLAFYNAVSNPTLNSFWFVTPTPYPSSSYFVQSAETGYCLTRSGSSLSATVCNTQGNDNEQVWSFGGWNPVTNPTTSNAVYVTSGGVSVGGTSNSGPGVEPIGDMITFYPAATLLNTVLVNTNSLGATNCLTASGTSNLAKDPCTTMTGAYSAAVDVMPDGTIRFRTDGNCLDHYEGSDPAVAAQWGCNGATSPAKQNQQWQAAPPGGSLSTAFGGPTSYPLNASLSLFPLDAPVFPLGQSQVNGQIQLVYPPNVANAADYTWTFNRANDVATCVDTAVINTLNGVTASQGGSSGGRSPRQINLAGQLSDLFQTLITAFQALPGFAADFTLNNLVDGMQEMQTTLANPNVNLNFGGDPNSQIPVIAELAGQVNDEFHFWEADAGVAVVATPPAEASLQTIIGTTNTIMQLVGENPTCLWDVDLANDLPGYGTTSPNPPPAGGSN